MASSCSLSIGLLLIIKTVAVTAVPEREYYSLLAALRYRGYDVFANAITTTDLHYDIINGGNFTFFAPIDSVLYTLDMSMSAADYTTSMRFHVVPHRLSLSDIKSLPYGLNSFPTLLTDHQIHLVNPLSLPLPITVEGVDIAVPDLYYDTHIAVHGLESVIDFRSVNDTVNSTSIADHFTQDHTSMEVHREAYVPSPSPQVASTPRSSIVSGIDTFASPIPAPETSYVPFASVSPVQSLRQPVTKSESIIQPHQQHEIYFESVTQPIEEHVSIATRSEFIPQEMHHVSLATRSTANTADEYTQVDDTIIDCPIGDDDREWLNIANIRRGDLYMRELYTPTKMTCAHD